MEPIRIGIIGDYDPNLRTHKATNGALWHAGEKLSLPLEVRWLPTPAVERLDECDGLFAAAGTPYVSMAGAPVAICLAPNHTTAVFSTSRGCPSGPVEVPRAGMGGEWAT